jgi:putative PIN family toxin of toxin-antitoxin system
MNRRVVIDTNVYVSRALQLNSISGSAVGKAWLEDETLLSIETWTELQSVLRRPKFAAYIQTGTLEPYLEKIRLIATFVPIPSRIRACRDPNDDKFLEVAVHGRADAIVTGDEDPLVLNPFRGIAILTPRAYLQLE